MLNTKLRRSALVTLAIVLMLSVFAMTAFAEETEAAVLDVLNANEAVDVVAAPDAAEDLEVGSTAADAEEKAEDVATAPAEDITATTGETAEDAHDHEYDHEEEEAKGFTTSDLVLLIIFGVAVIVCAIVCIIKREKVGKFFRGLKSEFKKIVWFPWNQVRKNTIVVIIICVALAIVIGVLDLLFGNGITELKKIINP